MEKYGPERKQSPGPIDLAVDIAELARSIARSRSLVPSGATFPQCYDILWWRPHFYSSKHHFVF